MPSRSWCCARCGLAIIFGMMGVINLAHGEFIMCGAYVTVTSAKLGLPLPLAILCGALAAGLVGMLVERLVIRHLYDRPLDTIVATWGISLIATQGTLILLGPSLRRRSRRRSAACRSATCPIPSIVSC